MKIFVTILFLTTAFSGKAQNNNEKPENKTSIIISSGISLYSVVDKYISNQKYSGILTLFKFNLRNKITENQFRDFYFKIETGTINNFKVYAHLNNLSLGWDYDFKLNKKIDYDIFIGPAPYIYLHYRQQEISSQKDFNSNYGIISLANVFGIRSNNINKFNYKFTGRLGLISAGVNSAEDQQTKILTPFNGLQFCFSALASYRLVKWSNIAFEYTFQTYNITAWNKMYSLSDQLTLNLIFSF